MGCGGGSLDSPNAATVPVPPPQNLTAFVDDAQGAQLELEQHQVNIPPDSLEADTTVQLSTVAPTVQPPDPDFRAVGPHLQVNLGGVSHDGLSVTMMPPATDTEVFPVLVTGVLLVPLEFVPQSDGSVQALVPPSDGGVQGRGLEITSFQVGFVESIFDYPPHVDWGTYNGYYFNPTTGKFELVISLGQPVAPIPNLGPQPLMIVHGLGSNIRSQEFAPMADFMLDQGVATGIVGFEYDTLDSISDNGDYLAQFYTALSPVNPNGRWRHIGHSMGGLVSREAMENSQLPIAANNNLAAFLCSPHTGSGVINILQGKLSLFQRVIRYLVLNDVMDFTNRDGSKCDPDLNSDGFNDLRDGSTALALLNANAAQNHPQWLYFTFGGDDPGLEFIVLDWIIGQDFDDGLVDLVSANFPGIAQLQALVVAVSHTSAVTDAAVSYPVIQGFLTP